MIMQSVKPNTDLTLIGLESRDKRVYEALYSQEKASLRRIAELTGLNRGTVYEIIKKLTDMGLVFFTQTGERRHFSAAEPENVTSLIQERRDQLLQLERSAAAYIDSLRAKSQPDSNYFASFYESDEGIAAILRDVLDTVRGLEPREYYVFSSKTVSTFIYANFPSFTRRRIQGNIFVKVLSDSEGREKSASLSERRVALTGQESLNGYTIIYGSKVALISLNEANQLSAVVITDSGVANMQRLIFEKVWQASGAAVK